MWAAASGRNSIGGSFSVKYVIFYPLPPKATLELNKISLQRNNCIAGLGILMTNKTREYEWYSPNTTQIHSCIIKEWPVLSSPILLLQANQDHS